jgi:O-antigen/teichoic acid export membrane protein
VLYGERAIVGSTLSVVGLGLYVIPYELVARLSVIPGAFYAALFPAFSALSRGRPEILEETYRRALMALLMLIGPIVVGLAAFGGDVLRIWLNSGISEAGAVPLQLFAIGALMNCMAYVPLALLHGIGHPAIPAKIQAALILPTFVITWLLASTFGLPGAAAAWLCRMAADAYLLFHFAGTQRRGITISSLRQAGRGFLLTIAAAALGVASSSISAAPVRVAAASVILVGLALLFWRMVLTPADRAAILQYVTTAPLDLRGRAR